MVPDLQPKCTGELPSQASKQAGLSRHTQGYSCLYTEDVSLMVGVSRNDLACVQSSSGMPRLGDVSPLRAEKTTRVTVRLSVSMRAEGTDTHHEGVLSRPKLTLHCS